MKTECEINNGNLNDLIDERNTKSDQHGGQWLISSIDMRSFFVVCMCVLL